MSKKEKLGELITENEGNAEELSGADIKVASDKDRVEKKISKLILENKENAEELGAAFKIITKQEKEIKKQAEALIRADKEKEKRRADIISAKKELVLAKEREKLVVELTLVNKELTIQITERKQSEKALFESEERFRLLFNEAPLGYQSLDFDGNIIDVNQRWINTLGYSSDEVKGKWFGDFLPPANQDEFRKRFPILITQGDFASEFEMFHKNGNKLFISFVGKIGYDNNGEFKQTHCILQDITKHKKWEDALLKSEAKHSSMISNISDVIGIIGLDGRMKYKSSNIEKWFGWQPQDLIGTDGFSTVHPDDLERIKKEFFYLLEKENSSITLEHRYKCKDGSYKQIQITAKNLTNDPVINGVLLNYHDITERKQAEKLLKESEQKSMSIMENSADAIFITNQQGKYVYTNKAVSAMLGYTSDEMKSKIISDISHPDTKEEGFKFFNQILIEGKGFTEIELLKKDGNYISTDLNAVLLPDSTVYGSCRDITERKMVELELIKAKEKAEASDRLKTAFMNNISHEIRTPLNGILGFAPFVIEPDISQEEKESMLEILNISGDRLINTVTDYMDISLIASGNIKAYPKPINLSRMMEEVYFHFQKRCSLKNLELKINIPSNYEHFILTTDKEILTKVLNHLIDNAIKFTQNGFVEFGYIQKSDSGQKDVELFVKDTGQGITLDAQARIFDAFMQENIASTRGHEGSGLGLSIVKGLTQLLGGKIMLESEKDKGTTVSFVLPCDDCKEAEPDNVELIKDSSVEKSSLILIAEDDNLNYLFIETVLRDSRVKILKAVNGQEAVDLCNKHPAIDLVLMDIKMPVMNGIEATQQIKSFRKDLPIIAVTAFAQSGDEHRFREAGCDDYISKPINKTRLFGLIKKHCDK